MKKKKESQEIKSIFLKKKDEEVVVKRRGEERKFECHQEPVLKNTMPKIDSGVRGTLYCHSNCSPYIIIYSYYGNYLFQVIFS